MASPGYVISLLVSFHLATICYAAPISNETIASAVAISASDAGLREGSCTLGDVVYMGGDEWGGSSPCERCRCSGGAVSCAREHCEPRPGCKALHRPDQCCPIYQCECEQEGRIYGNGEKLVDPKDPCRVCYCQGGEVVCRRIACFVRDDCRPRAVPGRCCPEYDNCPLRGVTAIPGVVPTVSNVTSTNQLEANAATFLPKENIKKEITIKEITPVSEIPVMTDVKIKEILPSTSVEVTEFTSSKSPVIVREATSEKSSSTAANVITETPAIIEIQPSSPLISTAFPTKSSEKSFETKTTDDATPSKVSLPTQDTINSELYPSPTPNVATNETPIPFALITSTATPRSSIIDEEDPTVVEHNPAFPPIPDDLSVVGNHEEDTMTEQNLDGEHVSDVQDTGITHTSSPIVEATAMKENYPTTKVEISEKSKSSFGITAQTVVTEISTESPKSKESPMLNLRSAIPTEILNVPSALPEDITGELDDMSDSVTSEIPPATFSISTSTHNGEEKYETPTVATNAVFTTSQKNDIDYTYQTLSTHQETDSPFLNGRADTITNDKLQITTNYGSPQRSKEMGSIKEITNADMTPATLTSLLQTITDDSNISTATDISTVSNQELEMHKSSTTLKVLPEITSQTEFSSIPIETSDQNPQDSILKEKNEFSTIEAFMTDVPKIFDSIPEIATTRRELLSSTENRFDNVETTEFVLHNFGSSETVTEDVELVKISSDSGKSAPIITQPTRVPNFLNDLNDLVGDIVSIGDSNDPPLKDTAAPPLSNSEELIPYNAGYKSKNNNWNVNSISEVPPKVKSQNSGVKQKIEIEDDESHITDTSPPNDKVEPTTRRPIIDNVSNDPPENKTTRTDIEILTQSYVPILNRRPTKVVMKKNHDKASNASEYESTSISTELPAKLTEITNNESITSTSKGYPIESSSTTARIIETTTNEIPTTRMLDVSTAAPTNILTISRVPSSTKPSTMQPSTVAAR